MNIAYGSDKRNKRRRDQSSMDKNLIYVGHLFTRCETKQFELLQISCCKESQEFGLICIPPHLCAIASSCVADRVNLVISNAAIV